MSKEQLVDKKSSASSSKQPAPRSTFAEPTPLIQRAMPSAHMDTRPLHPTTILQMQRTQGNAYVQRLIAQRQPSILQRACPCNGQEDESVQRKSSTLHPNLQRCSCGGEVEAGGECAACRQKRLAAEGKHETEETADITPTVHQVLRSPGEPLNGSTRSLMESRFGHDFSQVRLHTDTQAAASAQSLNAQAYTVGQNIVFGNNHYQPQTATGQHLLAHELVHVLQQKGAGTAVQPRLQLGTTHDPAETEAESLATHILNPDTPTSTSPLQVSHTPQIVRRQANTGQAIGESRKVTLPVRQRGDDQVQIHVIRHLNACPCRNVPDARDGIFYNPDLNNLAIAYRHCRGRTTTDVYGQMQSNAQAFLTGGAPPVGTARMGIDVNVFARSVGGRVVLEATATNANGGGIGGHGQVVFQGGQWRLYLEPTFVRHLEQLPGGGTQNELNLSLGGNIGNVTFRVDLSNLLDPAQRSGRGTICIPVGSNFNICPFIEGSSGSGVTGGIGLDIPLDGPEVRKEECFQCYCPPPTRKYEVYEDVLPRDEPVKEQVDVHNQREFRYYFRLDSTRPAEDSSLRSQSEANLSALTSQVQQGGSVSLIYGYASPEATERHNEDLSAARGAKLRELVQGRVGATATLPEPTAGGELLGSRPSVSPSSRLGDIITEHSFRSAEDLSVLLLGEEIPGPELSEQFQSLFRALPEPADRLAVFGLTSNDAIAPQVLAAIEQFLQSGGRGRRPWEQIFRLLRVGVARVTWTEQVEQTNIVHHSGSVTAITGDDRDMYAQQAEATGEFGTVDPAASRPTTSSADSNSDCTIEPQRQDREQGCDYTLPASMRGRASAPGNAPRRF